MTQKTFELDIEPDKFYAQPDSVYIRIQFVPESDGYVFSIRNELVITGGPIEELPQGARIMGTFARGALEVMLSNPAQVYRIGMEAVAHERLNHLSDSEIDLTIVEPQGSA